MPDQLTRLQTEVAQNSEAIRWMADKLEDLSKSVQRLMPLGIFGAEQAVRNQAGDRDREVLWRKHDELTAETRKRHKEYDDILSQVRGFLKAVTIVWLGSGAAVLGAFAWLFVTVIAADRANGVQDADIAQLKSERQVVTIVSGATPEAQKAIEQVQTLTRSVKEIQRAKKTNKVEVPMPPAQPSLEAPANVKNKPRRPNS